LGASYIIDSNVAVIDAIPAIKVAMLASFWPVPPVISLVGAMDIGYPGRVEGLGEFV